MAAILSRPQCVKAINTLVKKGMWLTLRQSIIYEPMPASINWNICEQTQKILSRHTKIYNQEMGIKCRLLTDGHLDQYWMY